MSKLLSTVHVRDEFGTNHVFGPGSDVPAWAQKQIRNPRAWDTLPDLPDEPDEVAASGEQEPARSGRGSSLEAWKTYAKGLGIEVPDDADRDGIIKLVDEHKAAAQQ